MWIAVTKIKKFDEVTVFRLENALMFAFVVGLSMPVLSNLKGLLSVTVLSVLAIMSKLMMKTNDWFDKNFTLSQLYKMGVLLNMLFLISTAFYFYSPKAMVLFDSIISTFEYGIYTVYSIKLNHYLAKIDNDSFKDFQKTRNAIWAEGTLAGLFTASILSVFFNTKVIVEIVLFLYIIYVFRLLKNWFFFEKEGLANL